MGGYMSYRRLLARNGLALRKPDEDPDPYFRAGDGRADAVSATVNGYALIGDLGRMERDYLAPERYPYANCAPSSSPLHQAAEATGVDIETVRRVLTYVFSKQP